MNGVVYHPQMLHTFTTSNFSIGHGYVPEALDIRTSRTNFKTGFSSVLSLNWLHKFVSLRNNNNHILIRCIVDAIGKFAFFCSAAMRLHTTPHTQNTTLAESKLHLCFYVVDFEGRCSANGSKLAVAISISTLFKDFHGINKLCEL